MKPKNIFVDFHHASLLYSFILLFENRMGGNVYRPIGMDWAEKGFWRVYDHPATRAQFLGMEQGYRPIDGTPPVNNFELREGVYYCQDIDSGRYNKAITLDAFFAMDIDIVIATIPQHVEPFLELARQHPNHPKVIYQIGNNWNIPDTTPIRNIMASARLSHIPSGINYIEYHQEFDTKIFQPLDGDNPGNKISSFVNCFGLDGLFTADWQLFQAVEQSMPGWEFRAFGGQCRDGAAHGSQELANKMRQSKFVWHTKFAGDGYGHIIHNAAAVGRPMIVKKNYYQNKLGADLMIDGVTCIDIDGLKVGDIVEKINYYSEPARYALMCDMTIQNFRKVVDFEAEADSMYRFIENLV